MIWSVASSILKSGKTEICYSRLIYLICCTRNMNDGLIDIEEIIYKTVLFLFF